MGRGVTTHRLPPGPAMSNDPRSAAKPPLPLPKRTKSGTVAATRRDREAGDASRKRGETGRSGTMAALRPAPVATLPRPTNVLRRLDPAFTPDDASDSWEPRGTLLGGAYRESLPTIPSPEVLEARLLAELAEAAAAPAHNDLAATRPTTTPASVEPGEVRARAHFEPAHAPAMRLSPGVELEKAVPVILDPLALVSGLSAEPDAPDSYPPASALLLAKSEPFAALDVPPQIEVDVVATEAVVAPELGNEPEPELDERARITQPPARRRRRRPWGVVLLGCVGLGAIAGAGWHRYPAEFERGWQGARAELVAGWNFLEQQWSAARRALER